MSKPQKPCSKCKGEMKPVVLESLEGEHEGLKLAVRKMPAVACDQGHRRFVYPEFAALLMDLVMDPGQYAGVDEAVKKGLFKKHFHCPGCGKELPAAANAAQKVELEASFKHAEPFPVEVEFPTFRCGCGRVSVPGRAEVGKLAYKAIGHAYRAADIHPA